MRLHLPLPAETVLQLGDGMFAILNEVKNLIISTESIIEILWLAPQNEIKKQSLGRGEG